MKLMNLHEITYFRLSKTKKPAFFTIQFRLVQNHLKYLNKNETSGIV